MSKKKEAAINLVIRLKKATPKAVIFIRASIDRGKNDIVGADPGEDQLIIPKTLFPGNEDFFMITDGTRFFCMQRSGAQDVVHASFFSELKCRGHMKNSHNLS